MFESALGALGEAPSGDVIVPKQVQQSRDQTRLQILEEEAKTNPNDPDLQKELARARGNQPTQTGSFSNALESLTNEPATKVETPEPPKPSKASIAGNILGTIDALITGGASVIGQTVGQIGGTLGGVAGSIATGEIGTQKGVQRASEVASEAAQRLSVPPLTEEGKNVREQIGQAFEKSKLAGINPYQAMELAAASRGIGQQVKNALPQETKPRVSYADFQKQLAARQVPEGETVHQTMVNEARNNGFVITPRQARPQSMTAHAYEGISGSAKMEKMASIKNQANANKLIATEDLGLKPNEPITMNVLNRIRTQEGKAYEAVKTSGVTLKPNETYNTAISELGGKLKNILPGVIKNEDVENLIKSLSVEEMSPTEAIDTVKVLRAHATKNIKAGYLSPEKEGLGYAQRNAANALDSLIESNLNEAGKGSLATAYKNARIKIAKTHDIEAALNETTGNVDPLTLGKMLDKGKPLTGGSLKVAKFARAFSGSARNIDTMKDATNFSLADAALGFIGGQLTPLGAAAIAARPAARSLALSKAGQSFVAPIKLKHVMRAP